MYCYCPLVELWPLKFKGGPLHMVIQLCYGVMTDSPVIIPQAPYFDVYGEGQAADTLFSATLIL